MVLYERYRKDTSASTCILRMHTAKTSHFTGGAGHPSHSTTSSLYTLYFPYIANYTSVRYSILLFNSKKFDMTCFDATVI